MYKQSNNNCWLLRYKPQINMYVSILWDCNTGIYDNLPEVRPELIKKNIVLKYVLLRQNMDNCHGVKNPTISIHLPWLKISREKKLYKKCWWISWIPKTLLCYAVCCLYNKMNNWVISALLRLRISIFLRIFLKILHPSALT